MVRRVALDPNFGFFGFTQFQKVQKGTSSEREGQLFESR